jgi:predicted permease
MNPLQAVIQSVLPVFSAALAGFAMRRVNWLTEEADASLLRITINLLAPCLAFDAILGNQALAQPGNLVLAPLIGFSTVALGIALGLGWARLSGLTSGNSRRTFAYVTGIYNYGYVPLPLALSLFNRETAGVLMVHNVGVEVALWMFGLSMLGEQRPGSAWRKVINIPVVAILVSVVLNLAGARQWMPAFVPLTAHMLGQCAIPMGLILIGATIADHIHEFHPARGGRVMMMACLLRLGILPLLFLGLASVLEAPRELKAVMVLQAAMPAAVFPIVMSRHYGGDTPTALRVVMVTSLVSLFTMPLWIRWGMKLIGQG